MDDNGHDTSKRLVTEGYLDKELKKYPTRWEMIAYLAGAVLANRFVENVTDQDVPKAVMQLIGMIL